MNVMGGLLPAGVILLFCLTPAVYAEDIHISNDTLDPGLYEEIVVNAVTVHIVNQSGSIREAVAQAKPGDRVLVQSGTYCETVDVDRALELWGIDTGGGKPVVCGDGSESPFTLSGAGISLEGFVVNGSGVTVLSDRNIISNNTIICGDILLPARTGGNVIRDNVVDGGNISITSGTVAIVRGNTLLNGSISLEKSYDATVRDNLISGGGISLVTVADSAFFNNMISENSGGCAVDARRSFCNLIAGNVIMGCGCGIRTGQSANQIYLNNFIDNTVDVACAENLSGGCDLWSSPDPVEYVLNGSVFVQNLGNYWDECNGTDRDGDGVLEDSYICGESSGVDQFPLAFPKEEYATLYADERP